MLVYVKSTGNSKIDAQGSTTSRSAATIVPTGPLAEKIAQINKEYDALWDDFEFRLVVQKIRDSCGTERGIPFRKKQLEESFADVKQRKLDVMKAWNTENLTVGLEVGGL